MWTTSTVSLNHIDRLAEPNNDYSVYMVLGRSNSYEEENIAPELDMDNKIKSLAYTHFSWSDAHKDSCHSNERKFLPTIYYVNFQDYVNSSQTIPWIRS